MRSDPSKPEWRRSRIGDVADLRWGDTNTTKKSYVECGYLAYSASGPDGFLPHADFDRVGVVLSAIGADCGKTWLARGKWSCIKNTIRFWSTDPEVETEYLYWITRDRSFWPKRGSAQPFISQGDARNTEVRIPPVGTQRRIVGILGSLDRRIDLLHEESDTLEAITQALFNSWFVDFDPVRAKADGREPEGMDAGTAALFPSGFEDSDLGPIPQGWRLISFGDIATLSKGSVSPAARPAENFRHYSLPAFDAGQIPLIEQGKSIKSNKTLLPSDAVLVSKLNPRIPRIWFVGDVGQHAVCSTEFLVWVPKPGIESAFVYTVAASAAFNSAMRQLVTGTSNSHQRVKPDQLAEVQAAVISDDALAGFDAIAAPMLRQVVHNRRRAAALADLRDTLLPRLISGRLRIPEAEALVGEATG